MKRWLPPQPRLWPGDGKLYICAHKYGSCQTFGGIPFDNGVAFSGRPITSDMILKVKSAGQLVVWWEYVDGIEVQWFDEGPRAFVKVSEKPKAEPKAKGKKGKGK